MTFAGRRKPADEQGWNEVNDSGTGQPDAEK